MEKDNDIDIDKVFIQLQSSLLSTRLNALETLPLTLDDIHIRTFINYSLSGYYEEKKWKQNVHKYIGEVLSLQDQANSILDYLLELSINDSKSILIVDLCIYLLEKKVINDKLVHILLVNLDKVQANVLDELNDCTDKIYSDLFIETSNANNDNSDSNQAQNRAIYNLLNSNGEGLLELFFRVWTQESLCHSLAALYYFSYKQKDSIAKDYIIKFGSPILLKYLKTIIEAKSNQSTSRYGSLQFYIRVLNSEEWIEVEEKLLSAFKKAPEGCSSLSRMVISNISVDLSSFSREGLSTFYRMIKSQNDSCRLNGLQIFQHLSGKVADVNVLVSGIAYLIDALSGKEKGGILSNPVQRLAVAQALLSLVQNAKSRKINNNVLFEAATLNIPNLYLSLEKEIDEDNRYLISAVLANVFLVVEPESGESNPLYSTVQSIIKLASKKKDYTYSALLALSLWSKLDSKFATKVFTMNLTSILTTFFVEIIKTASTKPDDKAAGVLAFALILVLASESKDVKKDMDKEKLFQLVSKSSFLYDPTSSQLTNVDLSKTNDGESRESENDKSGLVVLAIVVDNALPKILSIVAEHFPEAYPQSEQLVFDVAGGRVSPQVDNSVSSILLIKLFQNCTIARDGNRFHILNMIRSLNKKGSTLISNIVKYLLELLRSNNKTVFSPSNLSSGLCFLIENYESENISDEDNHDLYSFLLLLSCHQTINASYKRSLLLWNKLQSSFSNIRLGERVKMILLSAIYSSDSTIHHAACRALSIIYDSHELGAKFSQEILLSIIASIRDDERTLSEKDIEIYLNPNLILSPMSNITIDDKEVEITNADRKKTSSRSSRKGTFGSDFVEDEDWAARVKQEKMQKLLDAKKEEQEINLSKNKKIYDEVYARVHAINVRMINGVNAILSISDKDFTKQLMLFTPSISPLLRSKLVSGKIFELISFFCKNLETEIHHLRFDIAYSLRVVELFANRCLKVNETESQKYVETVAAASPISKVTSQLFLFFARGKKMSIYSCALILPIIEAIFSLPTLLPGCEGSLLILNSLWQQLCSSSDISIFRKKFIIMCINVLEKFPRLEPSAEQLLIQIMSTANVKVDEEELLILAANGLMNKESNVRIACLKAIDRSFLSFVELFEKVFMLSFDDDEHVSQNASKVLEGYQKSSQMLFPSLLSSLSNVKEHIWITSARGISNIITTNDTDPTLNKQLLQSVFEYFNEHKPPAPDKKIDKGVAKTREIKPAAIVDKTINNRLAVAEILKYLGGFNCENFCNDNTDIVVSALTFIIENGVVDINGDVRAKMMAAGRQIIENSKKLTVDKVSTFLSFLEPILNRKPEKDENLDSFDYRREAVVIFIGGFGKYLDKESPDILRITDMMITALSTPSEEVQKAVSDCLVFLVTVLKANPKMKDLLEKMLELSMNGPTYGDRRGAAYGLGAFIKGLGLPALKQFDILNKLKDACADGNVNSRQGSLMALECLSERLGLLFEPYVSAIIPALLKSFSHSSDHVREAAQVTAKVIMGKLSAHGVKQVLTPIISSLPDEDQWKTRQEAIRLLGTMAHCAPKQLASCLPQVIPCLVSATSDPHPRVKESARNSLADISSVIRNPEILQLTPTLLAALGDPANKTKDALEALLECEFMHSIDAASLAILIPILGRGLKDRGADIKRKSSAITGNMMSMVADSKSLVPYLSQLIPGVKQCLTDPIPDVRATSAKALGRLICVGEEELQDLIPWLIATLISEVSPVERSGAAQGLAEVSLTLGTSRLDDILTEVLPYSTNSKGAAREGVLWLLSFLPSVLKDIFSTRITLTMPVVLSGFSDENEGVRDVAMRAGQVFVHTLGKTHSLFLLPALRDGMFSTDWRIRHSSVVLLSDLLYLLGETKAIGISEEEEDDDQGLTVGTSAVLVRIKNIVTEEELHVTLASLYITRCDLSGAVRQISLQAWKSIVNNTPKTLVDIMPSLVSLTLLKISSEDEEMRIVSGRTLGEVVRKMGDRVLPLIVPNLEKGLSSQDENIKQGACLGLAEIVSAANPRQIETFIFELIPTLVGTICDKSASVRSYSAKAFSTLCKNFGPAAIDAVIPTLLQYLTRAYDNNDDNTNFILLGLTEIVQQKPRDLFEYLFPKLTASPISLPYAKALSIISTQVGNTINYFYSKLVVLLVNELILCQSNIQSNIGEDKEVIRFEAIKEASSSVMSSVTSSGLNYVVTDLGKQIENETDPRKRTFGCWLTEQLFRNIKVDISEFIPVLLKYLLGRIIDTDNNTLVALSSCLNAISTTVPLEIFFDHIDFIKNCLTSSASDSRYKIGAIIETDQDGNVLVPLFKLDKSLDFFVTTYIHALMNGPTNVREIAADAIGELMNFSSEKVIKAYLIKTTGPLIRVVGDRFPSSVKAAVLSTLCIIMKKGGIGLKPFSPQLQTTFVKNLIDPSKIVRKLCGQGLGALMTLTVRVDPLLNELLVQAQAKQESNAIKVSILEALAIVLRKGGNNITMPLLLKVVDLLKENLSADDDSIKDASGKCLGAVSGFLDSREICDLLIDIVGSDKTVTSNKIIGICNVLQSAGSKANEMRDECLNFVNLGLIEEKTGSIKVLANFNVGNMLKFPTNILADNRREEYEEIVVTNFKIIQKNLISSAMEIEGGESRRAALTSIKILIKSYKKVALNNIDILVDPLIASVKDTNPRIMYLGQRCLKFLLDGEVTLKSSEKMNFIKDYYNRVAQHTPAEDSDEE